MSLKNLRISLPILNGESLDIIFERVYEIAGSPFEGKTVDCSKLQCLLEILQGLQKYIYKHRMDDAFDLHQKAVIPSGLELQSNSSGSELWLAMLLAVKEVYGLSNSSLTKVIRQISVRN